MPEIIFICGVNGVGKSTLIPHMRALLPREVYDIRDFDERGVPENAGSAWRISETKHWLEEAERASKQGRTMIVCGFIKPSDLGEAKERVGTSIQCILLDARPDVIRARLTQRYTKDGIFDPRQRVIGKTVEEFIEGNLYIREQLKTEFEELGSFVIGTSDLEPDEVAKKVVATLFSHP